jgi:tetratricopeptide (TPR) repeat protein
MRIVNLSSVDKKEQAAGHFQAGRLHQAHQLFSELCAADSNDTDSWYMLGIVNGQLGDIQGAEQCSRKALALRADFSPAWDNLGIALMLQGRLQEAENSFQRSLQINPADEQACNALGNLMREQGRHEEAINYFRRALSIKPDYAEAHNNLANIYKDRCQFNQATASYRQALKHNPQYVDAYYNLGTIQAATGDYPAALDSFMHTLKMRPRFPEAVAAIASVHEKQGKYDKAYEIMKPLLTESPVQPCIALAFACIAPRMEKIQEAKQLLEQALSSNNLSVIYRQELLFKLGDLHDKTEDYEKAFHAYQSANSARPFPSNPLSSGEHLRALKETYDRSAIQNIPQASNTSSLPVFIVGMPRSGTSLVEQILSSHPMIFGAGELPYLNEIISAAQKRRGGGTQQQFLDNLDVDELDKIANEYLDKLSAHSVKAARITDKMPHNFLHLGLIDRLFPGARVIHCMRDPMDTCLSIYFQNFNDNHPYAGDLRQLGTYYKAYQELMQHWKQTLSIPIFDVKYESLGKPQTRRILRPGVG